MCKERVYFILQSQPKTVFALMFQAANMFQAALSEILVAAKAAIL